MDHMEEMDDVYCVHAGKDCDFDGMMELASTPPSPKWKFRLGVEGIGFVRPRRIPSALKPLAPIVQRKMVLLGRAQHGFGSLSASFTSSVWVSLLRYVIVLLAIWLLTVLRSTQSFHLTLFARAFLGDAKYKTIPAPEYLPDEDSERWRMRQEHISLANRLAMRTVRISATAFLALTIIMWETMFVYYLLEERSTPKTLGLWSLRGMKLISSGNNATEDMLAKAGKLWRAEGYGGVVCFSK